MSKISAQMLAEAPRVLGTLLARFERDIHWLSDYKTAEEQEARMRLIYYAVRIQLMIDEDWTHEASTSFAEQYRMALRVRLKRPEHFNPALRPRQPQDAT